MTVAVTLFALLELYKRDALDRERVSLSKHAKCVDLIHEMVQEETK